MEGSVGEVSGWGSVGRRGGPTDAPLRPAGRPVGQDRGPPARARGVGRGHGQGQPPVRRGGAVPVPGGHPLARPAGTVRRLEEGAHPLRPLGQDRRMGAGLQAFGRRRRRRVRHDRQHDRSRPPAQRRRGQKGGDEAIGRSRGGLSTKVHALVDALGNPTGFALSPGQAHDLDGADALLPDLAADALIADKAFDAEERVLAPLARAGKAAVIPPKANRKEARAYDKDLYKARHLIENFFAKLKQYRAIATRYDKRALHFLGAIHLAATVIWLN